MFRVRFVVKLVMEVRVFEGIRICGWVGFLVIYMVDFRGVNFGGRWGRGKG